MFVDCISMGGNMLLDIGPMEDGTIPERQVETLLGLGKWIKEHEEAIYGTEDGTPQESLCLKGLSTPIKRITVLHSGKELTHEVHGGVPWFNIPGTTWINIRPEDAHEHITVVKVELEDEIDMYGGSGAVVTHN